MPDYKLAARRAARKHGIREDIFLAMIKQESGFKQGLRSPAGARDIAQFIPSTAKAYGVTLGDGLVSDDLDGAARYLKDNLKRTGGNYTKALSIYNSGRPDGYLRFGETKNYVKNIRAMSSQFSRSGSSGGSRGGSGRNRPGREYRTETVPGVDRSADRQAAKVAYLRERGKPGALVGLKQQLDALADTPASSRRVAVEGGSSSQRSSGARGASLGREGRMYGGSQGEIIPFSQTAHRLGLKTTSAKRDTVKTASGNTSDHYKGNRKATARDWAGPPEQMDRLARKIARDLGVKNYKGGPLTVTRGGFRFQLLWKTNVGGSHFDHVHLGVAAVGEK